jgi:hypothetical protein
MATRKPKEDPELDAIKSELEALKGRPEVFGSHGDHDPAQKIDPATVLALIELVIRLVERFRRK